MPFGGVISLAPGINLQPNFPGVQDNGNGNISGNFEAQGFISSRGNKTDVSDNQIFGLGWAAFPTVLAGCVGLGAAAGGNAPQFGDAGAPGQAVSGAVAIGRGAAAQGDWCIAIGENANAQATFIGVGSLLNGANICIGLQSRANAPLRTSAASSVAIGQACTTDAQEWGITVGSFSSIPGGKWVIALGGNISTSGTKVINIATPGWTVSANNAININTGAGQTITTSNSITIGDSTHTSVSLGGVEYGSYRRRAIADTNFTVTSTNDLIAYTSITAARVVSLPAANTVAAGKRYTVTDESGNCSVVNTITITPAGADTFVGGTALMLTAYAVREFYSDGVSKWIVTGVN